MNICVIICAAGASTRFGGNKLDADLGGRTVLQRTVELFTKHPAVHSIVVAGPHDNFDEFQLRYGDMLRLMGCTICKGGQTHRWESVLAALEHVPAQASHIAVHDGARCCTPVELLDRLFEAVKTPLADGTVRDAVLPGVAISDTVKRVSDAMEDIASDDPLDAILGDAGKPTLASRAVEATVDRANLVAAQTPQVFAADLLRRAYGQDELSSTDDAGLVERLGEAVHVLEGDPRNIKITTRTDLAIAAATLGLTVRD